MTKLAKSRIMSKMTISKAVKKIWKWNLIAGKVIRIERKSLLLNNVKNFGDVRIFVDEQKFVVNEKSNRRNSREIAKSCEDVPVGMESKHFASVVFFFCSCEQRQDYASPFHQSWEQINTSEYAKILKEVLMPWSKNITIIRELYSPKTWRLLIDLKPYRICLWEGCLFVPKDVWLSSSPDLNPYDYWLWGQVEKVSNKDLYSSIVSLKSAFKEGFRPVDRGDAVNACKSFRRRIQLVIGAGGSHIK